MSNWETLLHKAVEIKGRETVAAELGIAKSSLGLLLTGKYPASTARIERKVMNTYGRETQVQCPILGEITAIQCRQNQRDARDFAGKPCGDPDTRRLFITCPTCPKKVI